TSVSAAPRPDAATTGNVMWSGRATARSIRSLISRDRGPGISVTSSIVFAVAISPAERTRTRLQARDSASIEASRDENGRLSAALLTATSLDFVGALPADRTSAARMRDIPHAG